MVGSDFYCADDSMSGSGWNRIFGYRRVGIYHRSGVVRHWQKEEICALGFSLVCNSGKRLALFHDFILYNHVRIS